MTLYLFEFYDREDKTLHRLPVTAANAWDAFDMFRAQKPHAVIAEAWVMPISARPTYVDMTAGLAG